MDKTIIENAKITGTQLGMERSIMTAWIYVEGNGMGGSFGGYVLDRYDKEKNERFGTAVGLEAIRQIMKTLEVECWEEIKGHFIRIEHTGTAGKITKIGHLIKDKWFSWEEFFDKYKENNNV